MTERLFKGERRQAARQGKQLCNFDLGGDSAPDPGPAAEASKYAAEKGFELGTAQINEARRQYDSNVTNLKPIVDTQLATMQQNAADAQEDRGYNLSTFRPLEQSLVRDAQRYDTEENRSRLAAQGQADVQTAKAQQEAQSGRAMARRGVNPGSARFAALEGENTLRFAGLSADAGNRARTQALQTGQAMKTNAVGLGRGLTGAAQGAYGLALQAGNSAGANTMAPGNAYMQGLASGSGTIMQGAGQQVQGLTGLYSAQANAEADKSGGMMGLMGAGLGAAAKVLPLFI